MDDVNDLDYAGASVVFMEVSTEAHDHKNDVASHSFGRVRVECCVAVAGKRHSKQAWLYLLWRHTCPSHPVARK